MHRSVLLGSSPSATANDEEERASRVSSGSGTSSSTSSSGEDAAAKALWTQDSRGLLRPVFRFLEIDPTAWPGLEEMVASPEAKHHIGAVQVNKSDYNKVMGALPYLKVNKDAGALG